jgi:hypothetical protein
MMASFIAVEVSSTFVHATSIPGPSHPNKILITTS